MCFRTHCDGQLPTPAAHQQADTHICTYASNRCNHHAFAITRRSQSAMHPQSVVCLKAHPFSGLDVLSDTQRRPAVAASVRNQLCVCDQLRQSASAPSSRTPLESSESTTNSRDGCAFRHYRPPNRLKAQPLPTLDVLSDTAAHTAHAQPSPRDAPAAPRSARGLRRPAASRGLRAPRVSACRRTRRGR